MYNHKKVLEEARKYVNDELINISDENIDEEVNVYMNGYKHGYNDRKKKSVLSSYDHLWSIYDAGYLSGWIYGSYVEEN